MTVIDEQPGRIMDQIAYGRSDWAIEHHGSVLRELIETNASARICDVGGGAKPRLPIDYVLEHGLEYTMLDVSPEHLARVPKGYRTVVADICSRELPIAEQFDLVVSRFVAEHVRDAEMFHRNVHRLLTPGGIAFHFFPTLFAIPFVFNRLLPEGLSATLTRLFTLKEFRGGREKFPAHYHWCRGPGRGRIVRLEHLGYRVLRYHGFFGHRYYERFPLLHRTHAWLTDVLVRHPVPALTSYTYLVLQRETE
jgi:SAM-dependent methyltransferase